MNMQLAERYVPLADGIAKSRSRNLPPNVTFDDVRSAAYYGLADAASRYDDARGVPFSSYARSRISGEITDFFRGVRYDHHQPEDSPESHRPSPVETDDFFDFVDSVVGEEDGKLVRMYYVDGRSLREAGECRGVGEARASQILKECRNRLRKKLKNGNPT
jgi:RNA polymerase sigma factor (sigma-70 family)